MYVNPRTGRSIKKGGPTYRALVSEGLRPRRRSRSRSRKCGPKPRCRSGQILRAPYVRKAYTRRDGTRVRSAVVCPKCIRDKGKRGKGPKLLPKLRRGVLGQYGYSDVTRMSAVERHNALDRAVRGMTRKVGNRHDAALKLFRRLNAVWVYNRNTNKRAAAIFLRDRNYVRQKYGV